MDEENKIYEAEPSKPGVSKCREEPFPPKLKWWQKYIVLPFIILLLILALLYLADQLCFGILPPCISSICCTYIAFTIVLAILIIDCHIHHDLIVHKKRLEDISEIEAMFVEARTVEPTEKGPMFDRNYFDQKKTELLGEVRYLKERGNRTWTEYKVLSLNQMLMEFLEVDELKVRARSSLAELEDYAEDSAYRYDQRQYDKWKDHINEAITEIDGAEDDQESQEKAVKVLQAELQMLLEHLASYHANWSKGSAIINGIKKCASLAMPLLLGMGLLPILYPINIDVDNSSRVMSVFNWGIFGIIGAITAVLLGLRKSDYVEVGNTEGMKELWRTIPGIALGFLAGTLAYWMIAGGLFTSGSIVPNLDIFSLKDTGLSVLWAVASGFCFEKVFDRVVSTTVGSS